MPVEDSTTASAIRRHEERLAREPGSLAFAPLADLYRKAGRTREAIALCREGLERYPQYATARLILAKAWLAEGELEAAEAELHAALAQIPRDVPTLRLVAEVARRRGDLAGAMRALERISALDPADREAPVLLGLLRADGPGDGPGRFLADDTFITLTFGRLCLEQGLMDEAAQVFSRLIRNDPTNRDARDGLEQALRGRARRKG